MSKRKITILGTGNAMVKNCYNTCFMVENGGNFCWWMQAAETAS